MQPCFTEQDRTPVDYLNIGEHNFTAVSKLIRSQLLLLNIDVVAVVVVVIACCRDGSVTLCDLNRWHVSTDQPAAGCFKIASDPATCFGGNFDAVAPKRTNSRLQAADAGIVIAVVLLWQG